MVKMSNVYVVKDVILVHTTTRQVDMISISFSYFWKMKYSG